MVKNATASRTEWPTSSQRVRRRRDSKAYYNSTRHLHRNANGPPTTSASPSTPPSWRPKAQVHQQSPPEQSANLDFLNGFDFQSSMAGGPTFDSSPPQQVQAEVSWLSPMSSYTLPTRPPNSPQVMDEIPTATPTNATLGEMYDSNLQSSWQTMVPTVGSFNSDPDVMSDSFGSYESFNSLALTINTEASSISDSYACPESSTSSASSGAPNLQDLYLTGGYFQTRHSLDTSSPTSANPHSPQYPDVFGFEPDFIAPDFNGIEDIFTTENVQWPLAAATPNHIHNYQNTYSEHTPTPAQSPWNSQAAQENGFGADATAGCMAFEPARGVPYDTFRVGEEYLQTDHRNSEPYSAEPRSPAWEGESDGWQMIPSYPPSTIHSYDSPQSQGSPWSHVGSPSPSSSPPKQHTEPHSHVFSAYPGEPQSAPARGRQRPLTSQEKQEALVVRKAKACWACHLSKIKCSPCSPGSPCQQCERLAGKRRFCWLPCFNDPLETLHIFMAPEYLYGNYSKAKVEIFVNKNATRWESHEMVVRMMWGYRRPLEETVVALLMHPDSELAYAHQVISNGPNNKPTILRKKSPPLGIPLAAMDDMQDKYGNFVQEIVTDDLSNYVSIAYRRQGHPDLPERLLQAIANFYSAALAAGDKCDMLRQALEIHVTSTILQRSFILDENSLSKVESYLQEEYPSRSVARLAQKQIKVAFYEIQRSRISKVLEDWGKEMWTSNKHTPPEKKWAITFSVLVTLTLVVDKILASTYSVCETEIKKGADPRAERAIFRDLVRLTEKELFDRCKEIFHTSFKTRKAGKEAYNPIRDGKGAFRGKAVNEGISRFVWDLDAVMRDFEPEIRSHRSSRAEGSSNERPYTNLGRLASVFLADFLDH